MPVAIPHDIIFTLGLGLKALSPVELREHRAEEGGWRSSDVFRPTVHPRPVLGTTPIGPVGHPIGVTGPPEESECMGAAGA